jgi:hypothetical protein
MRGIFSGGFEYRIVFENGLVESVQSFDILQISFLDGVLGLFDFFNF